MGDATALKSGYLDEDAINAHSGAHMHRPHARPRAALAALPLIAVVLGLSACTDSDAEPPPPVGNSEHVTTSDVATSTPDPTVKEAEEFTREVVAALSTLSLTGETEKFAALVSPSCVKCSTTLERGKVIKAGRSQGMTAEGQPIHVESVKAATTRVDSSFETQAHVRIPTRTFISPSGEKQVEPAKRVILYYTVSWDGSRWLVVKAG